METFYWVTLVVATVLLVVILIGLGILMSRQKSQLTWPPKASTCPDYWNYNTDTKLCELPASVNTGALYDTSDSSTKRVYVDATVKSYSYKPAGSTTTDTQYTDIVSIANVAKGTQSFPTAIPGSSAGWWSGLNVGEKGNIGHAPFPVIDTKVTTPATDPTTWSFDPNDARWGTTTAKSPLCAKQAWAVNNNIEWDGVSNYTGC